jgi:hypothetical protein
MIEPSPFSPKKHATRPIDCNGVGLAASGRRADDLQTIGHRRWECNGGGWQWWAGGWRTTGEAVPRRTRAHNRMCMPSRPLHSPVAGLYRCPNGPPGTDPARTRFGPVRIGPGQARPVDASGQVGLAHVPRDMPKPGTHREKSCRAGPLARWASTDRAGHWPEPTVERYINTYI